MSQPSESVAELVELRGEVQRLRQQLSLAQVQRAAGSGQTQPYVERLRVANEELRLASESLDAHREELQASNEELQTANEELLNANEELRGKIDELDSANVSLREKIDELDRANGDLQNLMGATSIATVFLDRELRVTRFTPAASELFHLIAPDVGRPLTDLHHDLDYPDLKADAATVFADLRPIERELTTSQGRWFLSRLSPYRTVDDRIAGSVLTCVDITERRQTEALRQAKEAAERLNQARIEFLSRMSHELRTPLNAILGFGQVLQLESRDEQDKEALGLILKAGRHLLCLVNEVLDLTRAEAGELRLSMSVVSPKRVATECLHLVANLAAAKQVVCEAQTPALLLEPLWTDEQRLRQVLLNLLTNAVKYNRPGGRVTLSWRQDPPGFCLFNVRDTGHGIAPEDLSRLFTPFERLHAEHGQVEGTGLGLAITRCLAQTLGGTVGVESQVGEGSNFWIRLPLGRVPRGMTEPIDSLTPDFPEASASPAITLLCIEDNASNAQLMRMLITRLRPQWRFSVVGTAHDGLREAREHPPQLILLDYQLPDQPGDWVLAKLRDDPRTAHVPVLVLTADATAATRERFLNGGATAFLSKPFHIDEMMRAVDDALHLAS